jgi:hypothetical protein
MPSRIRFCHWSWFSFSIELACLILPIRETQEIVRHGFLDCKPGAMGHGSALSLPGPKNLAKNGYQLLTHGRLKHQPCRNKR